jgi:flagellar biosynthetic protein FlhB
MAGRGQRRKDIRPNRKRKRDAAQNGDVLRSRELGTAAGVFTGIAWLWLAALAGPTGQIAAALPGTATIDHFDPGQRARAR